MKIKLAALLALFFLGATGISEAEQAAKVQISHTPPVAQPASDRLFFPKHFLRGYMEAGYFPPHNEVDLGRCTANTGAYGGSNAPCAAFGRYVLGGYAEFQLFGRSVGHLPLSRVYLFIEPRAFFGNNVPQVHYSESMTPIAIERTVGIALEVRKNFEIRVWQHENNWLGRYRHYLGPADLGSNGPYGQCAGVSTRWYFGGYRQRR